MIHSLCTGSCCGDARSSTDSSGSICCNMVLLHDGFQVLLETLSLLQEEDRKSI